MLIDKERYKNSLADLWHYVFLDDYSYIELIFNKEYDNSILCFGEVRDDRVVSAFYLLRNTLYFEGKLYKGFYLYAAATLPEYRGEGLMSKLISEAQEYCSNNGYDFISLVPSESSLYGYYSRFGFKDAMYRCKNTGNFSCENINKSEIIENLKEALSIRYMYENNIITFDEKTFSYAVDCLKASGFNFYRLSADSYALYSKEHKKVEEFISPINKFDINSRNLFDFLSDDNITIKSPFELPFCESETEKCGMIYPINSELCREWNYTDIYMNIALD